MQFPSLGVGVGGEDDAGVPEHILDDFQVSSGGQTTGREQCSNPAEYLRPELVGWGYSTWLGIVGPGDLCGVPGPVTAGLAHPMDGADWCEVQQVGEDSGGQVGEDDAEWAGTGTSLRPKQTNWTVPASVDTRLSCPIRRESEKWVRHAARLRRSTRSSR